MSDKGEGYYVAEPIAPRSGAADSTRVFRARNQAQVARFLARETWDIHSAEKAELVRLLTGGTKVEDASKESGE